MCHSSLRIAVLIYSSITLFPGNCEADVDQMVLEFPVMADYCVLQLEDTGVVFASHGHVHNPQCMPPLKNGDILLNGHTHVPACEKIADENGNEYMYLNPGSVSIPKEGSSHSYMVYEKGTFTWKNMSGVFREILRRRRRAV